MQYDKFKIGLFCALAIIIAVTLFIIFGLSDYTTEKVKMVTYFKESVQGLDKGSLVKFRGVPIGKVDDITILIGKNLIRVDMLVDLSKVRTERKDFFTGSIEKDKFFKFITKEIDNGLCARLELNGISGFKYVEFDYRPADMSKIVSLVPVGFDKSGYFCIPSEPSMLSGLRYGLTEVIAKLAAIDYKKLADKIENVLTESEDLISDPQLRKVIRNTEQFTKESANAMHSFNAVFTKERMEKWSVNLEVTTNNLREISNKLDTVLDKAKVPETSESFRNAADAVTETKVIIKETLQKLNDTIETLKEMIRSIDDNPSSILNGKRQQR